MKKRKKKERLYLKKSGRSPSTGEIWGLQINEAGLLIVFRRVKVELNSERN